MRATPGAASRWPLHLSLVLGASALIWGGLQWQELRREQDVATTAVQRRLSDLDRWARKYEGELARDPGFGPAFRLTLNRLCAAELLQLGRSFKPASGDLPGELTRLECAYAVAQGRVRSDVDRYRLEQIEARCNEVLYPGSEPAPATPRRLNPRFRPGPGPAVAVRTPVPITAGASSDAPAPLPQDTLRTPFTSAALVKPSATALRRTHNLLPSKGGTSGPLRG